MIIVLLVLFEPLYSQDVPVESTVYNLPPSKATSGNNESVMAIGNTTELSQLRLSLMSIDIGASVQSPHDDADKEELIIIKEGAVRFVVGEVNRILGPGSVALFHPGDEYKLQNEGNLPASLYVIQLKARSEIQIARGIQSGGSFVVNWNDVEVTRHDRGARRNFFDKPSAMFERFEMHVTTLNKGLDSHAPHTHKAEEIILLLKGEAEMIIGKKREKLLPGGMAFLDSMVPHALKNTGQEACEYFAFQWNN